MSVGFAPGFVSRIAAAGTERRKLLIVVFQRGAVDGLNMVVPFGEADYYRARPNIAIAKPGSAEGAIDLNGFFGLHPRMAAFKPLWDRGELAIVHATGSHDTTRSHFDAQDYMESATPGIKSTRDGWLNRYLSGTGGREPGAGSNPLRGIALTKQMPRSLQGAAPAQSTQWDHGYGNAMFVIGGGVKGGAVYGRWPGLSTNDRFEGRDLAVTTDFRDVFGEVAAKHLGADRRTISTVFPGYTIDASRFRGVLHS